MLKIIKYFIFIALLWGIIAANAGYNYPYICNNQNCYITTFWEIDKQQDWYFLSNEKFLEVSNLKNYINNKLETYSNYYWNTKITIDWYYLWTGSIIDKSLTFQELLNQDEFYIAEMQGFPWFRTVQILETYESGRDYLFSNFTQVINLYHKNFPLWDRKNQLKNILDSIVYYDDFSKKFALKNTCEQSNCYKSNYYLISPYAQNSFKFISGTIRKNSDFIFDNFKVSEDFYISKVFLKWWESLDFNFRFEDYLDASKPVTRYNYRIYYRYEWEVPKEFLSETIFVSKDYKVSSPKIWAEFIDDIVDLEVLNQDTKKIKIWIKEWITLTKVWKVTFYFSVENVTTEEKFDLSIINHSPVEIIPSDEIQNWKASIVTPFTKAKNTIWFNQWDTFSVVLDLKDKFWNEHYDYNEWYEISLSAWTSDSLELAKAGSNEYSKVLTWVKTTQISPYYIEFKFRITKSWYHVFNWFHVKVKSKKNNSSYITPTVFYEQDSIIPAQLYDGNQKMNIYIKSPDVSDFVISCSKWPIVLKTNCTSDNFSWCNPSQNQSKTFSLESENGSTGSLRIIDYAYNVKTYQYRMDHIDTTPPVITIKKWDTSLTWSSYKFYASDDFYIDIEEKTTPTCIPQVNTHYILTVNGTKIKDEKIKDTFFSIPLDVLQTIWEKKISIQATDVYGNTSIKNITFNIYPNIEGIVENSTLSAIASSWEKYADNNTSYDYIITLKDKFWNYVYDREVILIDQNCQWAFACKTIKTDMVNFSWQDALIEYDYQWKKTDSGGKISFKLKSLSPWEFKERFKIVVKEWDQNYQSTEKNLEFYKDTTFTKAFLKPFYWQLLVSKDGVNYDALPEIWTDLLYKINLIWPASLHAISPQLTNFKEYIKPIDWENTLLQNLSDIYWLNSREPKFTTRINTSIWAKELSIPWIKISDALEETPIIISYTLWWESVRYYLASDNNENSKSVIRIDNIQDSFLWVKVIWWIQAEGKSEFTGQEVNISNLYNSWQRTQIRKNAYEFIKGMKNNSIVNKVKYVNGNITIPDDDLRSWLYETLVVVNGNVTINNNIDKLSNALFWIIVIKDNYDIHKDYINAGNVYITPQVSEINAIIYSDWWIISVDDAGKTYLQDSTIRTADLKQQLYLKGSVFTRNTIWWAILWWEWESWWKYVLPGGSTTENFDIAMIYDLNYVRRWNVGCDKNGNLSCNDTWEYIDPFIIEYDPRIQTIPPRVFSK